MLGNLISSLKSSLYNIIRMISRSEIGKTIAKELAKMGIRFGEIVTISAVFDATFSTYRDAEALLTNMFAGEAMQDIEELKKTDAWKRAEGFIKFLYDFNRAGADFVNTAWAVDPSLSGPASRLFSALSWSFGLGWLSWIAMSPILSHEVADQLNSTLQRIKRDRALRESVYERLFEEGIIEEKDFREFLKQRGYSEKDIDAYITYVKAVKMSQDKNLTKTDILRLYRENIIERELAKSLLMSIGYDENEAELLLILEDIKKHASS